MRWQASWTGRGRAARSCCGASSTRRGACASRTRRRSRSPRWPAATRTVWSDDGESVELGPGDVLITRGPRPYTVARRPRHSPARDHPAGPALRRPRRPRAAGGDGARRPQLGQQQHRRDRAAHRRLPPRGRGEPPPHPRAAAPAGAHRARLVHAAGAAAGRGDRQGRAGPGSGPRPAAGPAADRGAAHLVRPPRHPDPGLVPRLRRPGRRPGPAAAAAPPGAGLDGGRARRARPGCRGRRWPAGSPSWSANRR